MINTLTWGLTIGGWWLAAALLVALMFGCVGLTGQRGDERPIEMARWRQERERLDGIALELLNVHLAGVDAAGGVLALPVPEAFTHRIADELRTISALVAGIKGRKLSDAAEALTPESVVEGRS
jgi:hypothetical protein